MPAPDRYRRAIDLGVDYVELDVRRTVDGAYVIYHEPRTPAGHNIGRVSRADFMAELGPDALDLPMLIDLVSERAGLHIDLKETGYEADIVHFVLAAFNESQFVVTSLDDVSIRVIKERYPSVQAGLSLGRDLDHADPRRRLAVRLSELFPASRLSACRADFVAVHKRLATLRVLAYCARAKIPAWVWTLDNEADTARFWFDPRVAVVITDRPDLARRLGR